MPTSPVGTIVVVVDSTLPLVLFCTTRPVIGLVPNYHTLSHLTFLRCGSREWRHVYPARDPVRPTLLSDENEIKISAPLK
jgi:hypothetical protein